MSIIWTIVVGFAAGTLAKYVLPGKEAGGFVMTALLGIAGAFVGSFVGGLLGIYTASFVGSLLTASAGAVLILFVYRKMKD